ncbi:MAG TPA: Uma2 family endonuclease [Gemmatimonadaceae bacterium]|nr:Uma2 family endonuclease [Gemmatimonadaceae bacterium]
MLLHLARHSKMAHAELPEAAEGGDSMGMAISAGWTVEQLATLPDDGKRYEIIDGELYVTPSPVYRHQYAVVEMVTALRTYLKPLGAGVALAAPADVEFDRRTVVEPDVLVLPLFAGRRPHVFAEAGRLLLAVEVLSPGTAARDRGIKRELYQRQGVPEYWIVDLDARLIERWRPDDQRPEIVRDRLEWLPEGAREPFVLDVPAFFTEIGLE